MKHVIAVDQSTSATKALLFDESGTLLNSASVDHLQYYPKPGWVEHDAEEIYKNTVEAISHVIKGDNTNAEYSLAITNQRETVVVWNRKTGKPVCHAIVWQCTRGAGIIRRLKEEGNEEMVRSKSGLLLDPYFSASGVEWVLENVAGAREDADRGDLLLGNIDTWLIWKLTNGKVHATDYSNASRTLLFNIHTLDWDDDLLRLFTIPRSMVPTPYPCDTVFGETTVEGLFRKPIEIAGDLGDSHGALVGQMCFDEGMGKATYGTGSSVMVNIGTNAASAPKGLVTSVGYAACGKVFYAFEGNIHCTGATIKWLVDELELIDNPSHAEVLAKTVKDNGGVYLVPAFAGLGAPWWNPEAKAMIYGLTLGSTRAHIARAAIESIAYQIKDLVDLMTRQAGIKLKELRVDGGPTKNQLLMQLQADALGAPINRSDVQDASAFGAFVANGLARHLWKNTAEASAIRKNGVNIMPAADRSYIDNLYTGWLDAMRRVNIK